MKTDYLNEVFALGGKSVLVTGGAKGIGAGIALAFGRAGASVVVADTDVAGARTIAARITEEGGAARAVGGDVGRAQDRDAAVAATIDAFGKLDVLVNNAGMFPMRGALELTEELWDRVLGVNLKGAFFLAQRAARQMIAQNTGGSIVNITSIDALHPTGALAHYDASKGGLQMVTRSLALELAPYKIRVNSLAPGAIETPGAAATMATMAPGVSAEQVNAAFMARIPLKRMGRADDIANAALFLASRAADYVTGSMLVVDGGYLLA